MNELIMEEIKTLKKMYKFVRKNTEKLSKVSFEKFIEKIIDNEIFSVTLLNSIVKQKKNENDLKISKKRNRIMKKAFYHKQKIKHKMGSYEREAYYDKEKNKIICDGKEFISLNKFTQSHYQDKKPYRGKSNNAWLECECFINDKWVSTFNLPVLE